MGAKTPLISFNYIVMEETFEETVDFIKLFAPYNINSILYKHIRPAEGMEIDLKQNRTIISPNLADDIEREGKKNNIKIRLSRKLISEHADFRKTFCLNPWFKAFILPGGDLKIKWDGLGDALMRGPAAYVYKGTVNFKNIQ